MAGLDASGNLRYVGVVIGEGSLMREVHEALRSRYPILHCRELPSPLKRRLVEDLLKAELIYVCVVTRLVKAVREVQQKAAATGLRVPRKKVWSSVKRCLAEYLASFLEAYRADRIYADVEVAELLKLVGVKAPYGPAAELADPVAWANYTGIGKSKIEEWDAYSHIVEKALRRSLRRGR